MSTILPQDGHARRGSFSATDQQVNRAVPDTVPGSESRSERLTEAYAVVRPLLVARQHALRVFIALMDEITAGESPEPTLPTAPKAAME